MKVRDKRGGSPFEQSKLNLTPLGTPLSIQKRRFSSLAGNTPRSGRSYHVRLLCKGLAAVLNIVHCLWTLLLLLEARRRLLERTGALSQWSFDGWRHIHPILNPLTRPSYSPSPASTILYKPSRVPPARTSQTTTTVSSERVSAARQAPRQLERARAFPLPDQSHSSTETASAPASCFPIM